MKKYTMILILLFVTVLNVFAVDMNKQYNREFILFGFKTLSPKELRAEMPQNVLEVLKEIGVINIKNILKLCYSKRKFTALELIKLSNRYEQFLEMTEEDGRDEKDRDQSVMLMYELIRRQREER